MKEIALVTDSTSDIPASIREKLNVTVIPLKIVFENKVYSDGIDLTSDNFYQLLQESPVLPKSCQPTPEDFTSVYTKLLEQYKEVLSIHISSGLSGTLNAAHLAKQRLEDRIHIVDSKSISLGIGLLVNEAARHIKEGLSAKEIVNKLQRVRKNSETLFTLNTLEYLQKGGRIGKVSSLMGSMLNIKPIIRVNEDGIYVPYGKVRSQNKALAYITQSFQELAKGRKAVNMAVAHGAAHEAGLKLKEMLENTFNVNASFTQVGPVIGVHTGPGTIGAAIQFKDV